jgi:hypothetical protein
LGIGGNLNVTPPFLFLKNSLNRKIIPTVSVWRGLFRRFGVGAQLLGN